MKLYLVGKKIIIRKLKLSDANGIYYNVKDKTIVKWTLNIPHPYPKNGARKFIRHEIYKIKKKKGYAFGITLRNADRVIGVISLFKIDQSNKNAELGYWLGKKYWGQGIMTEAIKLILIFGFKHLKLHRIYANLFEENLPSKRILEKVGFKLEAKLREERFRYGKWHNVLRYGIIVSEWR